jgi:hypothetical protein
MRAFLLLGAVAIAAPALAQSPVYTNADLGKPIASTAPLSPDEAVRVLRASHSSADLTDYHGQAGGPTIVPTFVMMRPSLTPWEWSGSNSIDNQVDDNVAPWGSTFYVPRAFRPRFATSGAGLRSRAFDGASGRAPRVPTAEPIARPTIAPHIEAGAMRGGGHGWRPQP